MQALGINSSMKAGIDIFKAEGIKGLYRGF